jgi:hypothetical protein
MHEEQIGVERAEITPKCLHVRGIQAVTKAIGRLFAAKAFDPRPSEEVVNK